MKYTDAPVRWRTIALVPVLLALIAGTVLIRPSSLAAGKKKIDTPQLTFVSATKGYIEVQVCADTVGQGTLPATGLPAGFSIQWITQTDLQSIGGWPVNSDDPANPASYCKASFSGQAFNSTYNLAPGGCVTVRIGDLISEIENNGASSNCLNALECGTDLVFRAFGHANSTFNRSDFTPDLTASTLDCDPVTICTLSFGYYKTHYPAWGAGTSLTLGTGPGVFYTQAQLESILQANNSAGGSGNGLVSLAHQLIAAKLNRANGSPSSIDPSIAAADALIGNRIIPPLAGFGFLSSATTGALTTTLDDYNTGNLHCGGPEPPQ
jgi:hypothetical protein